MLQSYTIMIKASKGHQPSSAEIHDAVRKLVDARVNQFPSKKSGTSTTIIPHRTKEIDKLRDEAMGPRKGFPKK